MARTELVWPCRTWRRYGLGVEGFDDDDQLVERSGSVHTRILASLLPVTKRGGLEAVTAGMEVPALELLLLKMDEVDRDIMTLVGLLLPLNEGATEEEEEEPPPAAANSDSPPSTPSWGIISKHLTVEVCPSKICVHFPVSMFHTRTVLSVEPDTRAFP